MQRKKSKNQNFSIGILGGGQLARMLVLAAHPLGIKTWVLSKSSEDPAARVSPRWIKGDPNSRQDVLGFAKKMDMITFESEFVSLDVLSRLQSAKIETFPEISVMKRIQFRSEQKQLLDQLKIPTSPWIPVYEAFDLKVAEQIFGFPFVIKKNHGGYDGFGTFKIKNSKSLKVFLNQFKREFSEQKMDHPPFIAEKWIPFKRELAMMLFRSKDGSVTYFPLVQTQQVNNQCDWVMGPIRHPQIKSFSQKLLKALSKINYVGALGVELFEDQGKLLVNELAPRVHNTGHFSQTAMHLDQFALHLLCGVGARLKMEIPIAKGFAMANLLGRNTKPLQVTQTVHGDLHIYEKSQNRPKRKMGHINVISDSPRRALKVALQERKKVRL